MSESRTNDRPPRAREEKLVERYRPLGLKAVAAAALHQKPKAKPQAAKIADTVDPDREHPAR